MRKDSVGQNKQLLICLILGVLSSFSVLGASRPVDKVIALTFDDGPSKQYTEEVLQVLQQYNIKATFFVMGGCVKNRPEVLKKVYAAGYEIGNHTYSHPHLSSESDSAIANELTKANEIIYQAINVYPVLFRPPYGDCSAKCTEVAAKMGYKKITWDYMPNDWDSGKTTSAIIADKIIRNARSGAIITVHDGGGNREKTVQALPTIITTLKKEGYRFVTVSELINIEPYRKNKL